MKIVNFSKSKKVALIQPDFKIRGNDIQISHYDDNSFRVRVGCKTTLVTPKEIDQMIAETNLKETKKITSTFIVPKGKTKATSVSPVFLEESGSFFISITKRVYPREKYTLLKAEVEAKRKYFKPARYEGVEVFPNSFSDSVTITLEDFKGVKTVLNTIKDFYNSNSKS